MTYQIYTGNVTTKINAENNASMKFNTKQCQHEVQYKTMLA